MPWLLLALLALPFHPFWPDFEAARRALALIAAGLLAVGARRTLPARICTLGGLMLGLVAWHWLRCIGAVNPSEAIARATYLTALAAVMLWARRVPTERWLRAVLPVVIAVSVYGLLQSLGALRWVQLQLFGDQPPAVWTTPSWWLSALLHTGPPDDPVSTLGNLNAASELVAVGGAAAAIAVLRRTATWLGLVALALGAAYLLVNGSRSGLLALPVALSSLLVARDTGPRRRLQVVAAVLAGLGLGLLFRLARPDTSAGPDAPASAAARAEARPRPSTIQVRFEIWRACLRMAAEHPLVGEGTGQFGVQYPRFRSQREIDLSTTGAAGPRSFRAAPRNPHNDSLQILTETGAIGLALWLATGFLALWRAARTGAVALAPLLAFAVLSAVRSPLGNAPVAVFVFGYAGTLIGQAGGRVPPWLALATTTAGLAMALLGATHVISATFYAEYPREAEHSFFRRGTDRLAALDRALAFDGGNADLHSLRLQNLRNAGRPPLDPVVQADAAALARLTPYSTQGLLLRAQLAADAGDPQRAAKLVHRLLQLDPRDPDGTLLLAALHFERVVDDATEIAAMIEALYRDPHPALLAQLPDQLDKLRREAVERAAALQRVGRDAAAGRYRLAALELATEGAFLRAIEALRRAPSSPDALIRVNDFGKLLQQAGVFDDPRPLVLGALALYHKPHRTAGDDAMVQRLGERAAQLGTALSGPYRRLLGDLVDPLRTVPVWRRVLREDP